MSQIPPADLYGQMPGEQPPGYMPDRPAPYSVAAIAAFILSLLGCLGVTAILGLILGVVGIITTRGGKRRGVGFAIAALPISLVTGVLSVLAVLMGLMYLEVYTAVARLPDLYDVNGKVVAQGAAAFRKACTDTFRAEVSEEQLVAWFQAVGDEHGAIGELTPVPGAESDPGTNRMTMYLTGKFVTGEQQIAVTLEMAPPRSIKIDDIEIAGSSPRSPE